MTDDEIDALSDDEMEAWRERFHDINDFTTMATKFLFGDGEDGEPSEQRRLWELFTEEEFQDWLSAQPVTATFLK